MDYVPALMADFRDWAGQGGCSIFGTCDFMAYAMYYFLRKEIPDIQVVYGALAWEREEPFAHWWNCSSTLGFIIDSANPYVDGGYLGPIVDSRYRSSRVVKLNRRDIQRLKEDFYGLDLDLDYYRNFRKQMSRSSVARGSR